MNPVRSRSCRYLTAIVLLGAMTACQNNTQEDKSNASYGAAAVDASRLKAVDSEPESWMSYGRDYSEQRYSPLRQVDAVTSVDWGWPGPWI